METRNHVIEHFIQTLSNHSDSSSAKYQRVYALLEYAVLHDDMPFKDVLKNTTQQLGHSRDLVRQSAKRFFEDAWFIGNEMLMLQLVGKNIKMDTSAEAPNYQKIFMASAAYLKKDSHCTIIEYGQNSQWME